MHDRNNLEQTYLQHFKRKMACSILPSQSTSCLVNGGKMLRIVRLVLLCLCLVEVSGAELKRIIDGDTAEFGRYSYMVGLFKTGDVLPSCGGSLVAPNLVLSAGHCIGPTKVVRALVGCYDLTKDEEGCEEFSISEETLHPQFTVATDGYPVNDVAILRLNGSAQNAPVATLPSASVSLELDQNLTILGWGAFIAGGQGTTLLQETEVNYISNTECSTIFSPLFGNASIQDNMLCASARGKDACKGDSGGPVVIKCEDSRADVQVGIISWGISCASPRYPGVYARIAALLPFITETVQANNHSLQVINSTAQICPENDVLTPTISEDLMPPTPFPVFPHRWWCLVRYYGTLDGCDCECGSHDPDCDVEEPFQQVYNCEDHEICEDGECVFPFLDGENGSATPYPTKSDPPASWHCPGEFYSAYDGCDCDCGALDPDCTGDPPQAVFNCDSSEICLYGRCVVVQQPTSASPSGSPAPGSQDENERDPDTETQRLRADPLTIGLLMLFLAIVCVIIVSLVLISRQRKGAWLQKLENMRNRLEISRLERKVARQRESVHTDSETEVNTLGIKICGVNDEDSIEFEGRREPYRWARFSSFKGSVFF